MDTFSVYTVHGRKNSCACVNLVHAVNWVLSCDAGRSTVYYQSWLQSSDERKAIKELKENSEINIKKADKGTTTVIMNKQDKITEGQIQLRVIDNYRTLETPMVKETSVRVERLVTELYQRKHIDAMTKKWLSQTPNPPRIPEFYTLTKVHKANPVGRPIISGCEGPTERISSFVDSLLQPIAKQ